MRGRRPLEKCQNCKATVRMISGLVCPRCDHSQSLSGIEFKETQFTRDRHLFAPRAGTMDEQDGSSYDRDDGERRPLRFDD